jgi:hypothetical protein
MAPRPTQEVHAKLKDMIEELEVSNGVVSIILRGSVHALSCSV